MKWSKHYYNLLFGLGISQLGNWIYLIALNVFIWNLTQSPAAVAGLYVIGPIVRIICCFFVGSYIDRWDKKRIVIITDVLRGIFVCFMPFVNELWLIYLLVAFTNVASTFFVTWQHAKFGILKSLQFLVNKGIVSKLFP